MDDTPAEFWAFALPAGQKLSQIVPKRGCVCITSAVLASPSTERVVLTATSGGMSAVLCNLFGNNGHEVARLGQPFHDDFELSVTGGNATVHITGFARGDLGPAELIEDDRKRNERLDGKAAAAPTKAATAPKKAVAEPEDMRDDDDDDDDEGEEEDDYEDSEDGEEGDEEEESGEEESGEEEDEDEDEDEDEEDGDGPPMPLAPTSVEAILKGVGGKKRPLPEPTGGSSKAAKTAKAPAATKPATPAKPAEKPAPPKPAGPVRLGTGVELTDVSVGGGAVAQKGKKVNVKYYGTLMNGKKFDAGTIAFRLGGGEVIPGWDAGIVGMKVGGKRKLKIPPGQAYGKRGAPPTIPPNSTLLFDVQLLSV